MDYQKLYDDLISKARSESRVKVKGGTYYEAHHILPKCLGGEGKCSEWRTHPNIILLTAKEHFFAHHYLTRIHPDNHKLSFAFWGMCRMANKYQERDYSEILNFSELYGEAKIEASKATSAAKTGKKLGPQSPKTKAKMSAAKKGMPQSPEHIAKASAGKWKPIAQYTKDGVWIRDWPSIKEAAEALGIERGSISKCLKGRYKSAGGCIWRYKS